jgi:precorrin-6Y C5,15-methyltransferase (decarboxylating)
MRGLERATHAFIGGSAGNMQEIVALLLEKNPDVRIVATAITLESIAELTACMKRFAFTQAEVVSMSVARDKKAGPYHRLDHELFLFDLHHCHFCCHTGI